MSTNYVIISLNKAYANTVNNEYNVRYLMQSRNHRNVRDKGIYMPEEKKKRNLQAPANNYLLILKINIHTLYTARDCCGNGNIGGCASVATGTGSFCNVCRET